MNEDEINIQLQSSITNEFFLNFLSYRNIFILDKLDSWSYTHIRSRYLKYLDTD